MAADFNKPTVSDVYTAVPGMIRDNDAALATMHETDASSNKPTGAKQITAAGNINRWNGSAWVGIGGAVPAGCITPYVGAAAPTGWLLADGSAVSQTTYAALFAAIGGHVFGADPGSGNFLLPNLKGKVVVGFNSAETEFDAVGETGGAKTHSLVDAEIQAHAHGSGTLATASDGAHGHTDSGHTHGFPLPTGSAGVFADRGSESADDMTDLDTVNDKGKWITATSSSTANISSASAHTHAISGVTGTVGSGQAHNNLQPYITLKYIIKT